MKLSEFKPKSAAFEPAPPPPPGTKPILEPQGTTTVTPSGIEIEYCWAPRRLYRLRERVSPESKFVKNGWREVPSVTTVLGVLDKSGPLTWWGMKVGIEGVSDLLKQKKLTVSADGLIWAKDWLADDDRKWFQADTQEVVSLLTEHKLTVNHVKDKAADRGVNVHGALEQWVETGKIGDWGQAWPEHEGYFEGLRQFCLAIEDAVASKEAELMVGSLEHQYAGRFDLVLTLSKPVEVVTRVYPKKPPRIEEIPAGRYLLDLKTSKRVYDTHYLQLEAYEAAAVECGYAPTDYRGVVHVTEDGRYELALNKDWTLEDFLAVRKVYQVMNEREVLRVLREDLDAQEVK